MTTKTTEAPTWTCEKCNRECADAYWKYCPNCGTSRQQPEPPAMSAEELIADSLDLAMNEAWGIGNEVPRKPWTELNSVYQTRAICALAKARSLLAGEVVPLTEDEITRLLMQWRISDSYGRPDPRALAKWVAEAQRRKTRPASKAEPVDVAERLRVAEDQERGAKAMLDEARVHVRDLLVAYGSFVRELDQSSDGKIYFGLARRVDAFKPLAKLKALLLAESPPGEGADGGPTHDLL
jgi:hypothetical protein